MKEFIEVTKKDIWAEGRITVHYSRIYFERGVAYFEKYELLESVEEVKKLITKAQW